MFLRDKKPFLILISIFTNYVLATDEQTSNYSWVEESDERGPTDMDIFFDRIVFVTIPGECQTYCMVPGVFITHHHVLTSYNPFRQHSRDPKSLDEIKIIILTGRILTVLGQDNLHQVATSSAVCARQVVPIPESSLTTNQWHGLSKAHSPLHDLMVIKIQLTLEFLDPDPSLYSFFSYSIGEAGSEYHTAGPLLTAIANRDDYLDRGVKFASLAFRDSVHIREAKDLRSREYEEDDNVLTDCEEWFSIAWGRFICVDNIDGYKGLGSGAMLFYNDVLYGVGSFLQRKGNRSILVFTDVRPYKDIVMHTCQ